MTLGVCHNNGKLHSGPVTISRVMVGPRVACRFTAYCGLPMLDAWWVMISQRPSMRSSVAERRP